MDKLVLLSSFVKGFKRKDAPDIINALFVAETLLNIKSPFDFENRDNNGVDSPEIRKLLFFNEVDLSNQTKEEETFCEMGKRLAELPSRELKWMAQFLLHKETHLFPEEAEKAKKLIIQTKDALEPLA